MKHLLLAACLTLGLSAHADTLGFHLGSHHFPAKDYNNVNPGVYVIKDNGLTLGTYYNSERKQSVYAGWTWDYGVFRLQAGAITGYRHTIMPMLAPSVSLGHGFRLTALPKIGTQGANVLHLTWETKI